MIIALWIVNGLLALAMLASGSMKTLRPVAALHDAGLTWVNDFPTPSVKLIGIAEVLGALGLILPVLTDIAPALTPIAAVALGVLMVGAIVVHARRKEQFIPALVLTALSIASAVLGFLVITR